VHDAATHHSDQGTRLGRTAGPVLIFISITAFLFGPRSAPGVLTVLAGVLIGALIMAGRIAGKLRGSPLLWACLAFLLYCAVNAAWSSAPREAYGKVLFLGFAMALVYFALAGLAKLDDRMLREIQRALLLAVLVGLVFLTSEMLTGMLVTRTFFSVIPIARPDPKHIQVVNGWVTRVDPTMLNRNTAALCFVLWPAFLMMRTLFGHLRMWLPAVALLAVASVAIFASEHETSMIAMVFAAATLIAVSLAAPLARKLVLIGWTIATLLVVPLAVLAFDQQLHFARWLPETGRSRIILWAYTAKVITKAPILGIGIASTKELDEEAAPTAEKPPGYTYPLRTGRHSHNIFMQTWYELGAVGAILLFAVGVSAIATLSRLPKPDQPLAFAGFVSIATIGAFSWGMWQTWFIACYGIWAVVLGIALEGSRRHISQPEPHSAGSEG
jgi:O-antigen ligase